jgi:hypothetical protein
LDISGDPLKGRSQLDMISMISLFPSCIQWSFRCGQPLIIFFRWMLDAIPGNIQTI